MTNQNNSSWKIAIIILHTFLALTSLVLVAVTYYYPIIESGVLPELIDQSSSNYDPATYFIFHGGLLVLSLLFVFIVWLILMMLGKKKIFIKGFIFFSVIFLLSLILADYYYFSEQGIGWGGRIIAYAHALFSLFVLVPFLKNSEESKRIFIY
ncbi:MAG: hypothetical protein HRU38_16940 [Saccharospirillaceae bacterium]|nr:hypothetical protein [Pseudomonadales bacterium]NRB80324.1 hypothetical protein [Saccharospirillaceae bacterium]